LRWPPTLEQRLVPACLPRVLVQRYPVDPRQVSSASLAAFKSLQSIFGTLVLGIDRHRFVVVLDRHLPLSVLFVGVGEAVVDTRGVRVVLRAQLEDDNRISDALVCQQDGAKVVQARNSKS
jgi:hypothetical protein